MKSLRRTGSARGRARLAQVVERAAEVERLGEDRQRRGAAALVGAARRRRPSAPLADLARPTASGACARRSARCPGASSASRERAGPRGAPASARLELGERHGLAAPAPTSSRVASTMRSRTLMRAPPARRDSVDVARRAPCARAAPASTRLARRADALARACRRRPGGVDRGAGVEQPRGRARGPGSPARIARVVAGVGLGRAAGDARRAARGSSPTSSRRRRRSASIGVAVDLDDVGRRRRAHLVEAVVAGHYQRPVAPQPRQRARDRLQEGGVGDADHLARARPPGWSAGRGS